jgi:hypothetical protein
MITLKAAIGTHQDGTLKYVTFKKEFERGKSLCDYLLPEFEKVEINRVIVGGLSIPPRSIDDLVKGNPPLFFKGVIPYDMEEYIIVPAIRIEVGALSIWGITIAGTMYGLTTTGWLLVAMIVLSLVSYILTPKPNKPTQGGNYTAPTSAGWNGIQNTYGPGKTIPVIFGEHRAGVHVAYYKIEMEYMTNAKKKIDLSRTRSYVKMIGIFGRGEINAISSLEINNEPINNFGDEVKYTLRYGAAGQTAVPGFDEVGVSITADTEITSTPASYTTTEGTEITAAELLFVAPGGVGKFSEGAIYPFNLQYTVTYQRIDIPNQPVVDMGTLEATGQSTGVCRWKVRIDDLTPGRYTFTVTYIGPAFNINRFGKFRLSSVTETTETEPCAYDGLAYVALEALATEHLNDQPPTVTGQIQGVKIPVLVDDEWVTQWSNNNFFIAREVMLNDTWGFGAWIQEAAIDDDTLEICAAECDEQINGENRHTFNLIWDQEKEMMPFVNEILFSAKGKCLKYAGKWRFIRRTQKNPVQLFTAGNVVSSRIEYVDELTQQNALDVTYLSAVKKYTPVSFRQSLEIIPVKPKDQTCYGVTIGNEAARLAEFVLNISKYVTEFLHLEVSIGGVACWPGNPILFSDVVQGASLADGRLSQDSANVSEVYLDESIEIESGKTYGVTMTFSGGENPDVIETRIVSNSPGTTNHLTVTSPFSQIPLQNDVYAFGETDFVTKKYWIDDFERSGDLKIKLVCSEDNDHLYEETATAPAELGDPITNYNAPTGPIPNLNVREETKVGLDGMWSTNLNIYWPIPTVSPSVGIYRGANLYYDSPEVTMILATFEEDETWTGGEANTELMEYREKEGTQSRKITSYGSWEYSEMEVSHDLSDIINFAMWFYIFSLDYCASSGGTARMEFFTSTNNYYYLDWEKSDLNDGWNLLFTPRLDDDGGDTIFTKVGNPSWANITKLKVAFKSLPAGAGKKASFDTWKCLAAVNWKFLTYVDGNTYYWPNAPENTFLILKAQPINTVGIEQTETPAYAMIQTKGKTDYPQKILFKDASCTFTRDKPYFEWGYSLLGAVADDGGIQTDETDESMDDADNDMTLLPALPAVNDAYYFIFPSPNAGKMWIDIGTAGVGTWTITWEYYNGESWVNAFTYITDGTNGFKNSGVRQISVNNAPDDWAINTIDGITGWPLRARVSAFTSITTQPKGNQVWTTFIEVDFSYYELRYDTNWGEISENLIRTMRTAQYEWKDFLDWALERGLTEEQKRSVTVYIKARDTFGNYSLSHDSITVTNVAPSMAGFAPTVTGIIKGLQADWSLWSAPDDILKYKIYASTTVPCPIVDGNLIDSVSYKTKKYTIPNLPIVEHDVRIVPVDYIGTGTASN